MALLYDLLKCVGLLIMSILVQSCRMNRITILSLFFLSNSAFADISSILIKDNEVKKLGTGMKFTEGPVWIKKEKKLIFSDIPTSFQMEWTALGGVKKLDKLQKPSKGDKGIDRTTRKEIDAIEQEVSILTGLDHPNIVKYYETYIDERYIYLVMEFIGGGELFDKIASTEN